MAHNWVKYESSEGVYELFNMDRATHFRHIGAGDESQIEIDIDGNMFAIMYSIDPAAYRTVLNYIKETTGYTLD
jgi:hypothetical protein